MHLAVLVPTRKSVPDALVVDLLPAGFRAENQNLAQSSASLTQASRALREWQEAMQNADIVHQEYRDDRYVAALAVPKEKWQASAVFSARGHPRALCGAAGASGVDVPPRVAGLLRRSSSRASGGSLNTLPWVGQCCGVCQPRTG